MDQAEWKDLKKLFHQALDLAPDERVALVENACNGNEQFRARVEALLNAHEAAGDFISAPALADAGLIPNGSAAGEHALCGQQISDYTIVRPLGRGGMGSVFLATRTGSEFNKQVALKIIKRGMDTDAILQRFMIERQILANLQHPHIAGFLDGGTTKDGVPFFVMEYVDGEPITKYCDAHELKISERLELFQRACAAVRHAHQNLIVHRDLKPSNILVTHDGTPKLLDFGIAKILNTDQTDTAATATAFRLMTPEYASPEQIRGLPITTATDVYSLGVVLYELLSGHRPFRFSSRSPEEVARVLLNTEPAAPSDVVSMGTNANGDLTGELSPAIETNGCARGFSPKALRGDLDNIVLKALRKERERRYASVLELSEDIRRHLAGLPVTARPDTFAYRAGKFVRRHRAGVAMAGLLFLILVTATAVTSRQAFLARREHARADLRAAEQRKLANSLISEVQASLKEVPHSAATQKLLAQTSLDYLNNLAKDAGDDPQFLGELAQAYRNLGYLQEWTLLDNPAALLSYERAIDLARRRLVLEPKSALARHALGDLLGNRIESLSLMDRADEASATYTEALAIEQQFLLEEPQNAAQLMRVAETSQAHGEVLRSIGQDDQANAKFQAAIDLGKQAVELFQLQAATAEQKTDLSLMQEKLASMFEQLHQLPQAAETYRQAVATAEAVHAAHPELVQALRNTTSSHWYLGMVLDREGDHQTALENYRASLKTVLDATAANPDVDPPRSGEMKYSIVVGRALCKRGQTKEGVPLIRHGVDLTLRLIESDKGNRQDMYYGSELLSWAVEGLAAAGLRDEATNLSLKMIDWGNEAAQNAPADGGPRLRLADVYEQLGDVNSNYDANAQKIGTRERPRLLAAEKSYQQANALLRDLNEGFCVPLAIFQERFRRNEEKAFACRQQLGGFIDY